MVKTIVFMVNRKKIMSLIYRVEQNFFIHGSKINTEEKAALVLVKEKVRRITQGFCVLLAMTAIMYVLDPVFRYLLDGSTNGHGRFMHPFKHRCLFDCTKSPFYEMEWIFLIIGCYCACYTAIAADTFVVAICLCVTLQFQMLASSLRESTNNIQLKLENGDSFKTTREAVIEREETIQNQAMDDEILKLPLELAEGSKDQNKKKFHREMHQYLTECIQHHQTLLQYVDDLNDALGPMFFSDICLTALSICVLEFWLVVTEDRGVGFIKALLHFTFYAVDFFIFNYLSSKLASESEGVATAAYDSQWYQQSISHQRSLCMIIMRAQKPVYLSTLNVATYSLTTFSSVMQTAYSYLTVMQNVIKGAD